MEPELGGPSTGSPTGTPSDVKGMQLSLKHCSSNGVTNGDDHIPNGHCEGEPGIENDLSTEITDQSGKQRQLTTLEKDIVCLIGQHLRESGYRYLSNIMCTFTPPSFYPSILPSCIN